MPEAARVYSMVTALLDFFGKKPQQTTSEFAQEIKALTAEDKAEFKVALQARGYNIQ